MFEHTERHTRLTAWATPRVWESFQLDAAHAARWATRLNEPIPTACGMIGVPALGRELQERGESKSRIRLGCGLALKSVLRRGRNS